MTQQELLGIVAEKIQTSVERTTDVVKIIFSIISEELLESGIVYIDDFGEFKTQKRAEYISLNNKTGEQILMPPAIEITFESLLTYPTEAKIEEVVSDIQGDVNYEVLFFEPDLSLRNSVNSAFINFTPTLLNEGVELSGIDVISDSQEMFQTSIIEDVSGHEYFLRSVTSVDFEATLAQNIPLGKELPTDYDPKDESEIEIVKPEQITSQEDLKVYSTTKLAPPIKKRTNNKILVLLVGGVAITLAALFFFNATSKRSRSKK